jgi:hypothetical protein
MKREEIVPFANQVTLRVDRDGRDVTIRAVRNGIEVFVKKLAHEDFRKAERFRAEVEAMQAWMTRQAQAQAHIERASERFDRWFGWLPYRMVPKRFHTEDVGDALERIGAVVRRAGSRWELAAVYIGVCFHLACEVLRYVVRSFNGRKAFGEPPRRGWPVLTDTAAVSRIFALPEIRKWARCLEQQTCERVRLHLRVEASPRLEYPHGSEERMWHIAVAESHPTHLSFHRRFGIDPDSGAVFERDVSGELRPYRVLSHDL